MRQQPISDEPSTPPTSLSTEVVGALNNLSPNSLRDVARYAEELAEHKECEARRKEEPPEGELEGRSDDLPNDVPTKMTITIKEINDKHYCYWQWRGGDKIRSKYKGPVSSGEWEG